MSESQSTHTTLVTFDVAGQTYALSAQAVERILPSAEVDCPPLAPTVLHGFLNIGGQIVPVLQLSRLFQLPDAALGLWTPLIVLRHAARRLALLVDRVHQVVDIEADALKPLPPGHALNDCVQAVWRSPTGAVLLLSTEQLLLQQEHRRIDELQELARQRLGELPGAAS